MAIDDGFTLPGIPANIDPDWAIERTNAALNTAGSFRDNLPSYQCLAARFLMF
jgi:hypothetical protein